MHKGIIILVIISVVLASLLAIQVIQDGNLAVTQLNTKPVAVQNIQPLPVTNTAEDSFNTLCLMPKAEYSISSSRKYKIL